MSSVDKIDKILSEIQLRSDLSSMETLHRLISTIETPSTTKKCQPQSPAQKLKEILDSIKLANWMLSKFFFYLFRLEGEDLQPVVRESQHKQTVTAMLNGTSKPSFDVLIDLIHRKSNRLHPSHEAALKLLALKDTDFRPTALISCTWYVR